MPFDYVTVSVPFNLYLDQFLQYVYFNISDFKDSNESTIDQKVTNIHMESSIMNNLMQTKINSLPKRFTAEQAFTTGDSWTMLACIDYLAEQGYIREVDPDGPFEQHREFVKIGI